MTVICESSHYEAVKKCVCFSQHCRVGDFTVTLYGCNVCEQVTRPVVRLLPFTLNILGSSGSSSMKGVGLQPSDKFSEKLNIQIEVFVISPHGQSALPHNHTKRVLKMNLFTFHMLTFFFVYK